MKLGIYGKHVSAGETEILQAIFKGLEEMDIPYIIEEQYYASLQKYITVPQGVHVFSSSAQLHLHDINCVLSLGGDGTLLDTLTYVKETSIPVIGINLGRLGFLSNIPKENALDALMALKNGQYRFDKRSLLELKCDNNLFEPNHFALNDFTIHKRDTGSMVTIDTYLNGEFFTTYWADGIIVSTPTGSTAYSLSCGGPILFPDSNSFVITPVAPHNLNIRPIVVADNTVISFKVKGRGANHLISLDSRYETLDYGQEIAVQKALFFFNLIKLNHQNFIDTLREKLKWGLDTRNS